MKYIREYKEIDFNDWDEEEENPNDDSFMGHEKFYNFLKKNNFLENYSYEINKMIGDYRFPYKSVKDFLDKSSKNRYIGGSFVWDSTNQNHSYWSNVQDMWRKIL